MKIFNTKNGVYYGLTTKELMWLKVNEKNLPQLNKKDKNMIYVNHEKFKTLI